MTINIIQNTLLWCAIINAGLLLFSFLMFVFARNLTYRFHGRWFKMSEDHFNSVIYATLGCYKILIFVFNIVPYIALRIIKG